MPESSNSPGTLTLTTADGPQAHTRTIGKDRPFSIGRLKESDLCLLHENVSRQHASILYRGGSWFVVDLDSKWGSYLNGVRLSRHKPAALAGGDLLRIGPWTFRVQGAPSTTGTISTSVKNATTLDDATLLNQRVERGSVQGGAWRADKRLKLVLESMSRLAEETEETALAATALDLILNGSGYARGAALRRLSDSSEVQLIAHAPNTGATGGLPEDFGFSRSLLNAAISGQTGFLTTAAPYIPSQSISDMRIHSAVCVPVSIGDMVVGFLYLDARGRENEVHSDALAFCEAIACAYSLALANIKRIELEGREHLLTNELAGARAVQEMFVPPTKRDLGSISYAARTQPGLFVAGDLFDVVPLTSPSTGEGGFAVLIGDVSGRGAAAGMLMAMVQAYLHAELGRGSRVADAVMAVNRYLHERISVGKFVSLWVGIFDGSPTVKYVDAGHGHWLVQSPGAGVRHAMDSSWEGGIPLGIDREFQYREGIMNLRRGEKLVLYSDGIIEQRDPSGQQFKRQRLAEALTDSQTPEQAVEACFAAVSAFAARTQLDDDSTLAVVQNTGHK